MAGDKPFKKCQMRSRVISFPICQHAMKCLDVKRLYHIEIRAITISYRNIVKIKVVVFKPKQCGRLTKGIT